LRAKQALGEYAAAMGPIISFKCSFLFGDSCPIIVKEEVRSDLDVPSLVFEENYLWITTPDGRMTRWKLQNLQAQLTKRILVWAMAILHKLDEKFLLKQ
jgi:hypothetical protein